MSEPDETRQPLDRLAALSLALGGLALCAIAAVQAWQVFARYVLNDTPSWTDPWTMTLLSAAMSFPAAAAVHGGAHFNFPLLAAACPPPIQRALQGLSHAVVAGLGGLLAWWSGVLLVENLEVRMAGTSLPEGAPFAPLCVGGALMTVFALGHLLGLYRRSTN